MLNNVDRAVQFQPFDALNGFRAALNEVERIVESKKILSEDIFAELDDKIIGLKKGDLVHIKHYYNFEYIETTGTVRKIDGILRKMYLSNCVIDFDDIIYIDLIEKIIK